MSIEKQILEEIQKHDKGVLFLPEDFDHLGSSEAVRLSLHRLVQKGELFRVTQGIYVRPTESDIFGKIMPTAEDVAAAIAKRDKIKVVPTGSYALNALGLSTQVPLNIVFLTDGAPRTIQVGKRKIKFKRTTPKNLLAKGSISKLVIQALREIGNGKVTADEESKIIDLLEKEEKENLIHDIELAPVWIKKIMKKAL